MSPADEPAQPTALGVPLVELQRSAHQVLRFHLAPECVAGVAKCLDDLAVHIERVRAFTYNGDAPSHVAAGSDGAGGGATGTDGMGIRADAADTGSAGAPGIRAIAADAGSAGAPGIRAIAADTVSADAAGTRAAVTDAVGGEAAVVRATPRGPRSAKSPTPYAPAVAPPRA